MSDSSATSTPSLRLWLALVLLWGAALTLPFLGLRDIATANEAQRSVPPREMIESGDWVVPRLNGQPYLKKPPMLYWEIGALYLLLGEHDWVARLPSVVAGLGLIAVTMLWASEVSRARTAALAGIFTLGNYLILTKMRGAYLDIHLALWTTLTFWLWDKGLRACAEGKRGAFAGWVLMGSLPLALANLFKFPVSFIFLVPGVLGACLLSRRPRWLLHWAWPLSIGISLIPLLIWARAVGAHLGEDAWKAWSHELYNHTVTAGDINTGPVWYYAIRLIAICLPWWPVLLLYRRPEVRAAQAGRLLTLRQLSGVVVGSFVLLSLNIAKETEYIICAIPCLAILMAWAAEQWLGGAERPWRAGRVRLLQVGVVLWSVFALVALPLQDRRINRVHSVRGFSERVLALSAERGQPLAIYDAQRPQLTAHLRRIVPEFNTAEEAAAHWQEHPETLLITFFKRLEYLEPLVDVEVVMDEEGRQHWVVLERVDSPSPPAAETSGLP